MNISFCEFNFNITDKNVSAENHRETLKLIDDQNSVFIYFKLSCVYQYDQLDKQLKK